MDLFAFTICARTELRKTAKRFGATHVVSTVDPGVRSPTPFHIQPGNHLRLFFLDEEDPKVLFSPEKRHVESVLAFGRRLTSSDRVCVHCEAGISRSSAVAFLLAVQALGLNRAEEALARVVAVRPQAIPNLLVVSHGDALLGAGGKLVALAEAQGLARSAELLA